MILDTLTIENFGIFKGKHIIKFKDKDVVGIVAEYEGDKKRSNRSGKSLIMEAIRYNLTGLVRSKKEINMIHHGEKHMMVTASYIDSEGKDYLIRRGRDHKNNGVLELDWISKTKESQAEIDKLFGTSKDDFDLTNFFKQADINGFMDKTPTEQARFLMKWLDNEHWKRKEELAKADRDVYKERLRDNEATKKALEESLEMDENLETEKDTLEKQITKARSERMGLVAKRDKIKKDAEDKARLEKESQKQISQLRSDISNMDIKANKIDALRAGYKTDLARKKTLEANLKRPGESRDEVVNEMAELRSKLKTLSSEYENAKQAKGVCPVSGASCDIIKLDPNKVKSLESAIQKTREKLADKEEIKNVIDGCLRDEETIKGLERDLENTKKRASDLKFEDTREELKDEIRKLLKNVGTPDDSWKKEYDALDAKIDELDVAIRTHDQRMGAIEHRITKAKESLSKIDEVAKRNIQLRQQLEDANYIVMMFGKNGIPADEIDNSFKDVEDNINYVLKELKCGLSISFCPDKEIDKWEAVCHCGFQFPKGFRGNQCEECNSERMKQKRDEISLKVLENGIEKDFDLDSGGGKTIISYAVRIALTMLKRQQSMCKLNMLFLDEVDTALDSHLAAQITNSITNVLTKKLGYAQILMVSHKEEVKNAVPHILKVTRKKTRSVVEFV